jgi:hypothetical protein
MTEGHLIVTGPEEPTTTSLRWLADAASLARALAEARERLAAY